MQVLCIIHIREITLWRQCNEKIVSGEAGGGFPSWLIYVLIVIAVIIIAAFVFNLLKKAPAAKPKAKKGLGFLQVQSGPLAGNRFDIQKAGLRIGRDPSQNQIVLSEDTVSREHAVIEIAPDGKTVRIKNLSATNPSYVNDRPITETDLKDGDRIKIGESILIYKK